MMRWLLVALKMAPRGMDMDCLSICEHFSISSSSSPLLKYIGNDDATRCPAKVVARERLSWQVRWGWNQTNAARPRSLFAVLIWWVSEWQRQYPADDASRQLCNANSQSFFLLYRPVRSLLCIIHQSGRLISIYPGIFGLTSMGGML